MRRNRAPAISTESRGEMELARNKPAERQLADVGITLGRYRLRPARGGRILRRPSS